MKSLIVKLILADMLKYGSGFSLIHDSNQLIQKEAVHYLRNDVSCMMKMTCSIGFFNMYLDTLLCKNDYRKVLVNFVIENIIIDGPGIS
jgi:hypothetical protein